MLKVHYQELADKIGGDVLALFLHIFEQTILMDEWLGRKQFLIEKVENAKSILFTQQ